jgi:putative ABC transport system permease protein
VIFAGIIAGSYSAFYISALKPADILSGSYSCGEISRFSKFMLASQLGLSMFAITSCMIFIQNFRYQQNIDLGFDLDQTIVVRFTGGEDEYWPIYNHLLLNPRIHQITAASDHVGRRFYREDVVYEDQEINVAGIDIGDNYFQVMEIDLLEGRMFDAGSENDHDHSVLINREFARHMDWENPLGKRLVLHDTIDYYVIGMVEDFYFDSYDSKIQPMWFRYSRPEDFRYLILKTDPSSVKSVMEEVHLAWRTVFNSTANDIKTGQHARWAGEVINGMIIKILIFIGFTTTLLSLVGLYALVSLNIVGKYKEIGIRKILGGSVSDIIGQINRPFITIFSVSVLFGAVLSYVFIPILLEAMWAYHIGKNVWVFLWALLLLILTTLLTVGVKARNAANTNPVNLIRN